MRSVLQITPTCKEIQLIQSCSDVDDDALAIAKLAMAQKIKQAKQVTLKDLRDNQHLLSEGVSYCFTGIIDKVENKATIWYDSCKNCNTSFSKIDESAICKKCNEEVLETSPRYRITINVIQGDCNARITLFGQVAEVYVGCSVDEYLSSIKEGETESTYYRRLSTQAYTEMRFMTMLKSIKFDQRGNLNIVANAIEKMEPMESIDVGDIEEEPTEVEEKKHSPEKSKNKIPSRKKKSTMELQPTESQKKKRRITKKKFHDYIDITSDDDLPLNSILQTKNNKKSSPIVKIKQEKI
ncbi:replication protein A 70 kDa DNA-binding subunit D-like [Salvia miltiorrhiza]|uniref:replication protein A 70 kDa DNA-binding subunit D-like n=1 Tax=Salvia miltiorrhiza TaxID=226208 RepID=UPI0025ACBEF3|nr:replication protein A 70 kDa DNA-binding subunit D-like [Salvia miltiorrhiza]